tara:strand:- start:467 stop:1462 length:996 start_codon:yes stop_codon:yes gene_type:complete
LNIKKRKREQQEASISFLDVISCGFGAIVLLLIIAKVGDPSAVEEIESNIVESIEQYQRALFTVRGETREIDKRLKSRREQLSELNERIARLKEKLASVSKQSAELAQSQSEEKQNLQLVMQVLTEEMQRLLGPDFQQSNDLVGGIPADSDYIIFVIDTSGSMQSSAWSKVQTEMLNILDVYPEVKGLQIMNDMGQFMFNQSNSEWIPDSPEMRDLIINKLSSWAPFSNSSPVEGIENAIKTFYQPKRKISIYTLGDDFQGRSISKVVKVIDSLNIATNNEKRLVRIHAIGFPVHLRPGVSPNRSAIRFAALMRELSYSNGGTFIGLNGLD